MDDRGRMVGSFWTRLGAIFAVAAATTSCFGQSLKDYLHLRRHYGISRAAGEPALETLVGTRVIEIAATVKGVVKAAGGDTAILIERSSGEPETIKADVHPDWLEGNEVLTRLLIRAYRRDANSPLEARMIAVAPDAPITRLEDEERAADEAKARKTLASRKGSKRHTSNQPAWTLPASEVTPTYAAFIKKQNPRLSGLQAVQIARAIVGFSLEYGVDARLIMAMVMVESGFDPTSTSHSGAMGLGQLMPGTAKWMGVSDAYDSTQNLYGTVKLVRTHLDQYRKQTGEDFESLVLTLAAYNAGEGAVKRHGGVPPYRETQAYVRKVMKLYYRFCGR